MLIALHNPNNNDLEGFDFEKLGLLIQGWLKKLIDISIFETPILQYRELFEAKED